MKEREKRETSDTVFCHQVNQDRSVFIIIYTIGEEEERRSGARTRKVCAEKQLPYPQRRCLALFLVVQREEEGHMQKEKGKELGGIRHLRKVFWSSNQSDTRTFLSSSNGKGGEGSCGGANTQSVLQEA